MPTKVKNESKEEHFIIARESFVRAAHAAACRVWKENIEKEFPELFTPKYKPGMIFVNDKGDTLLLAEKEGVDSHSYLVNIKTGVISLAILNEYIEKEIKSLNLTLMGAYSLIFGGSVSPSPQNTAPEPYWVGINHRYEKDSTNTG